MSNTITLTISQLENLLDRQKAICAEKSVSDEFSYIKFNGIDGMFYPMDSSGMRQFVEKCNYPEDFNVLKRYVK